MTLKYVACGLAAGCLSTVALAQATPMTTVYAAPAAPIMVQPSAPRGAAVLPTGAEVWVALNSELDSHDVNVGDPISFRVSRDVMLGNYVVIPRGTPASGHVTKREGRGMFGKSGKLEFEVDSVSLSGHPISVTGHYKLNGEGNTGATVGAVVAVGVIGGVFVKGHSATAGAGSEWRAETNEPIEVAIAGSH